MGAKNGQGTYTGLRIEFDVDDPNEARAWGVAQYLAEEHHGKRKELVVAFFLWLADYDKRHGYFPSASRVASIAFANQQRWDESVEGELDVDALKQGLVSGSASRASVDDIAANFAASNDLDDF